MYEIFCNTTALKRDAIFAFPRTQSTFLIVHSYTQVNNISNVLLPFHGNNAYANALQCYILSKLPFLFIIVTSELAWPHLNVIP